MKKRRMLVGLIVCVLCLSGCTSAISLTDDEENVIAEYLAGALLRSDEKYTESLIEPTPTPTPTMTPTLEPTNTPSVTQSPNSSTDDNSTNQSINDLNEYANADFAQVIGIEGITTEYNSYYIVPSINDVSFNLDLKSQDILLVTFNLTNQTKEPIELNLGSDDIGYQLKIDAKKTIKPLITFFDDDLRYINTVIDANDTITAFVAFGISKELVFDTASVVISRDDKTAIIKLK